MDGKYFKSFDGARIYYQKNKGDKNKQSLPSDDGKWLVFLHGFGGDLTAWSKERAYFTKLGISTLAAWWQFISKLYSPICPKVWFWWILVLNLRL